jgi:hypothetical protein
MFLSLWQSDRLWEKDPDGIAPADFINSILPNNIKIIPLVDGPAYVDVSFIVPYFCCSRHSHGVFGTIIYSSIFLVVYKY